MHVENLNCTSMVDLLILEGCDAVVQALRELAATAQHELHDHPENVELEAFASSLAWHYFCLWNGKKLRRLIREAAEKQAQATKLKQDIADFNSGFDAAMSELRELQKYVKLHGMDRDSIPPPLPTTAEPKLVGKAPVTIARLSKSSRSDLFLDRVAAELREAPWTRLAVGSEYHADPLQRLEFLEACQKLLPKIVALRRSATNNARLESTAATAATLAVAARDEAQQEWDIVREGKPFPPALGSLAREAIDQRRAKEVSDAASLVDTSPSGSPVV